MTMKFACVKQTTKVMMKKKTNAAAHPALWGFAMLLICFLGPTTKPVLRSGKTKGIGSDARDYIGVSDSAGCALSMLRGTQSRLHSRDNEAQASQRDQHCRHRPSQGVQRSCHALRTRGVRVSVGPAPNARCGWPFT